MLFNERRPTRIADVQSSDPPAQFLRSLLDDQASILLEGVQSWMWVPLAIKGRMIGAVGVAHAERNFFTAHHADLALTVANQAAITMVNAELYENAQTLAALQERQRLAQNLHDAVNQSLFSAGLIAEVLPRPVGARPGGGAPVPGGFAPVDPRRTGRYAPAAGRAAAIDFDGCRTGRPAAPVGKCAGRPDQHPGLRNCDRAEAKLLPTDVQVALYRLCQEGLNNIAKHASASQVDIQSAI